MEETANVDGIRMRWLRQGEGTPVVLVHGIPTSPALFRHLTPRLERARVLAWEMVGYGESIPEGRDRDISVRAQAGYLRSWMRALGIEKAVLVGHDLGGGVVQIAAVRDPAICAGLVLTNSIGYDSWPIPSVRAMRAMGALVARLPERALEASLGVLLRRGHDNRRMAAESRRVHFAPYAKHDGARALIRQMRALDVSNTLAVQDDLPRLGNRPARVVWGVADRFQKIRYGERLAHDLRCPLVRIEGGKHFVPEDHPDVLARAIREVVSEVERGAQPIAPRP